MFSLKHFKPLVKTAFTVLRNKNNVRTNLIRLYDVQRGLPTQPSPYCWAPSPPDYRFDWNQRMRDEDDKIYAQTQVIDTSKENMYQYYDEIDLPTRRSREYHPDYIRDMAENRLPSWLNFDSQLPTLAYKGYGKTKYKYAFLEPWSPLDRISLIKLAEGNMTEPEEIVSDP